MLLTCYVRNLLSVFLPIKRCQSCSSTSCTCGMKIHSFGCNACSGTTNPPATGSTLTAAGNTVTSYDTSYNMPFGQTSSSSGCAVAHATNTPYFVITESGDYTIKYQMTADNPAVAAGLPIDQTVELVSGLSGVLDSTHFTAKKQTVQKTIPVKLQAGDHLYFRARQPAAAEMQFSNQTVTITKAV